MSDDNSRKPPVPTDDDYMSVDDVCTMFGRAPNTIHRWIKEKGMPSFHVLGRRIFRRSEITEWYNEISTSEGGLTDEQE